MQSCNFQFMICFFNIKKLYSETFFQAEKQFRQKLVLQSLLSHRFKTSREEMY